MRQCIAIVLLLRYQIYSASISDKSALISNKVSDLPVLQYEDVQQTPLPTLATETTTAAVTTTTTTSTPSTATTMTLIKNETTSLPPQIMENTSEDPTVSLKITTTLAPSSNITLGLSEATPTTSLPPLGLSESTPTTSLPPTTTSQVINITEATTTAMTSPISIASKKEEETTMIPQAELTSTVERITETTSQVPTTAFASASVTELPFLRDYIEKRAAPEVSYKNGLISGAFIPTLDSRRATASDDAVKALDRKLEHGGQQKEEYVGVWISGMRSVWGKLTPDDVTNELVGSFVIDGQVRNTTESAVRSQTRMLIYKGTRTENNFGFAWVNARLLDQSTAVTLYSNICTQTAPAVYIDRRENYEFLGEADLVNKKFTYILGGHIRDLLDRNEFLNNVYVLTKQRCSCSCDSVIIG